MCKGGSLGGEQKPGLLVGGLCWDSGDRSTVPGIGINLQCDLRVSDFTCLATSVAPSPPLSPLVYLDHKFLGTGTAPSYMFAQRLAQRDLHSGDLRYHSRINNYSGGKSHPGALLYAKPLLFWAQGVSELEAPAAKLTIRGCWGLDPFWHSI